MSDVVHEALAIIAADGDDDMIGYPTINTYDVDEVDESESSEESMGPDVCHE
jgi:hypothetical protein